MQNKTARHWLPAIPRNIKLTELAAYVIILFEFMRTFFHGFYWQEGIRWRLTSSPLMLYKSVGGEYHVWLWNDFIVLHDHLDCAGCDRSRSQHEQPQEVKVKPPSIANGWRFFTSVHNVIGGEKPTRKRHPFLLLLYRISEALSNIAQRPEMYRKISPPPLTFPFPSGIISKVW